MSNALVPNDPAGAMVPGTETNASAAIARARAEVEAQYLVAERRPRSWDTVRQKLMKEASRSTFAEVALYELPRGRTKIVGPSIRLAEACRRVAGNMIASCSTVFDGDEHQILRVIAVDLETNAVEVDEITVKKFVERRHPREGDEVIGQRMNSTGQLVCKVRASDDDFRMKRRAESQRAKRNAILALMPGDIIEEVVDAVQATRAAKVKSDPDGARKRIVDGFAKLNVPADQLEKWLGHDLGTASPDELLELQAVWVAVKEGDATWHEALQAKTGVERDGDERGSKVLDLIANKKAALSKKRQPAEPKAEQAPKEEAKAEPAEPAEEPSKPAAKKKRSKKKAAAKSEPVPADVAAVMEARSLSREDAEGYLNAGYELDPATGELVPPAGGEG